MQDPRSIEHTGKTYAQASNEVSKTLKEDWDPVDNSLTQKKPNVSLKQKFFLQPKQESPH
jgi:hypothetical protein